MLRPYEPCWKILDPLFIISCRSLELIKLRVFIPAGILWCVCVCSSLSLTKWTTMKAKWEAFLLHFLSWVWGSAWSRLGEIFKDSDPKRWFLTCSLDIAQFSKNCCTNHSILKMIYSVLHELDLDIFFSHSLSVKFTSKFVLQWQNKSQDLFVDFCHCCRYRFQPWGMTLLSLHQSCLLMHHD